MNAVHVIFGDDLQQGVQLELQIARIGGAEPIELLAVEMSGQPTFIAHALAESCGSIAQPPVDLPDVHFQTVTFGCLDAFGDLITAFGHHGVVGADTRFHKVPDRPTAYWARQR